MFDLADRPRAWIEVAWPGIKPGEDDALAEPVEHKIEMFVEIVDRDVMTELFPRMMGNEELPPPDELTIVTRIATDWRQVGSKKKLLNAGKEIPFNKKNAALLVKVPMFGPAFTSAYINACGGQVKLREGNSESLPSGGQAGEVTAAPGKTSSSGTVSDSA